MTATAPTTHEWTERYAGSLMNTFGPPKTVLVRGEGAHVWDADGREYVEMVHREYNPVTEQLEVTAYILDAQTGQAIPADQIPADAVRYASSGGHSEYLKPGTASAHAMARWTAWHQGSLLALWVAFSPSDRLMTPRT